MKQKHIALVVKEENDNTVVPNADGTYTSRSWVINRRRIGYLTQISIHRKHDDSSVRQGTIVGYEIDPVTERISIRFQPHDQVVQGSTLNWGQEKAYSF